MSEETPLHELAGRASVALIDTETTGFQLRSSRILEVAAVRWDNSGRTAFETLVDPGAKVTIPREASDKHQITREVLISEDARPSAEVLRDLDAFLDGVDLVVAHNAKFDLGMLEHEYKRAGLAPRRCEFMCTQTMALLTGTGIWRLNKGGYRMLGTTLEEVASCLGYECEATHRAMADTEITEAIFPHLLQGAHEQGLDVLNLLTHPKWLVDKGVPEPDYVPPGGRVEIVS